MTKKKDGKSWFKSIASLVVEVEDTPAVESAETAEATEAPAQVAQPTTFNMTTEQVAANPMATVPASAMIGQFNQEIYNGLLELLAQSDLPGVDYFEFTKTKKSFESMPGMSEQQKVIGAFNVIKGQSTDVTKDSILNTADHYTKVLEKEQAGFEAEMDSNLEAEVTQKIALAAEKQLQIEALKEEIQTLTTESAEAQIKINGIKSNFEATIKVVKVGIETDKSNISQFIVESTPAL